MNMFRSPYISRLIITFGILLCYSNSNALLLSKDAEISLLTCSPGDELYSLFGHTAIRIHDPQQDIDIVFNYGTFDFRTSYFYLKYARGLLPYYLSINSYQDFIYSYQRDNRTIYAQTLLIDSINRQKLADLLVENYRPENRSYLYNFLFDNCTTRARDIIEKSLPEEVKWQPFRTEKSFWNLLDEYLSVSPWVKWGIHTILGQPGSRFATTHEQIFLPDYLMYGLDSAQYNGHKLAAPAKIVYQASGLDIHNPWYRGPFFVFSVITILLIVLLQKYNKVRFINAVTILLFAGTGLIGCLIVFLGGFTAHPMTAPNWNILWANPLNLAMVYYIPKQYFSKVARIYLMIYSLILVIATPLWFLIQPAVPAASINIIFLMLYLCFKIKNKFQS